MKKYLNKAIVCLCLVVSAGGNTFAPQAAARKIEIIATLFPTYDFAKQIGKDKVNVLLLLPPGAEPHIFEPKPRDIVRINKADIFVYTGKYMEPWAHSLLGGITNQNLMVVDSSAGIILMAEADCAHGHDDKVNPEHEYHHEEKDPHVWLDLENCQIMVDSIATALAEKDPGNKKFYLNNAAEYKLKLADLDRQFEKTLLTAKHKTIIYAGHFAWGYLARRYGLDHVSPYVGFSPNAEPSPKAIVELIKIFKRSGQKYVYYAELLDPRFARTIARETGAKLKQLHGAHNISKKEMDRGVTFLEIMSDNLKKLKVGLECR